MQTVYQVDESPRYASLGKWQHTGSFSTWLSAETWRPLPRREWSVRQDYQVLAGTNRHTILANGWVQEENNLKAVLTQSRELDRSRPYVGREYGVARYERIRDADFAAADSYYERTKEFWDQVRDRWSRIFAERGTVTLRGPGRQARPVPAAVRARRRDRGAGRASVEEESGRDRNGAESDGRGAGRENKGKLSTAARYRSLLHC